MRTGGSRQFTHASLSSLDGHAHLARGVPDAYPDCRAASMSGSWRLLRVRHPYLLADIDDPEQLDSLSAWVKDWDPCFTVLRPPREALLYEPDGTLYAFARSGPMTIKLWHRLRTLDLADAIVVPQGLALEIEPAVDLWAICCVGTPPDHFRERFIQVWGFDHVPSRNFGFPTKWKRSSVRGSLRTTCVTTWDTPFGRLSRQPGSPRRRRPEMTLYSFGPWTDRWSLPSRARTPSWSYPAIISLEFNRDRPVGCEASAAAGSCVSWPSRSTNARRVLGLAQLEIDHPPEFTPGRQNPPDPAGDSEM